LASTPSSLLDALDPPPLFSASLIGYIIAHAAAWRTHPATRSIRAESSFDAQ
jgi:hypothetical protein